MLLQPYTPMAGWTLVPTSPHADTCTPTCIQVDTQMPMRMGVAAIDQTPVILLWHSESQKKRGHSHKTREDTVACDCALHAPYVHKDAPQVSTQQWASHRPAHLRPAQAPRPKLREGVIMYCCWSLIAVVVLSRAPSKPPMLQISHSPKPVHAALRPSGNRPQLSSWQADVLLLEQQRSCYCWRYYAPCVLCSFCCGRIKASCR